MLDDLLPVIIDGWSTVPVPVADPGDPRLADFRGLSDPDVRPDRRGVLIAEGVSVVRRLLASSYRARAVVGVDHRIAVLAPELGTVPAYLMDKWALSELVGFRVTRGVLASADRGPAGSAPQLLRRARTAVLLEGLNDFENIGSVFRNAAAFGVDAVVLDPFCADPLYRRSVRVSMGHVLQVPFAVCPSPVQAARNAGLVTLALTPRMSGTPLREVVVPDRWAIVLGAEGPGLADATVDAADQAVRIPMAPTVDSLNVATAGAVALAAFTS